MKDDNETPKSIQIREITRRTQHALRECGREVLIRHKRDGFPIVSMKDGKVIFIPPEEIVIPPEIE